MMAGGWLGAVSCRRSRGTSFSLEWLRTPARGIFHDHGAILALSEPWRFADVRTVPARRRMGFHFVFRALATLGIGKYRPAWSSLACWDEPPRGFSSHNRISCLHGCGRRHAVHQKRVLRRSRGNRAARRRHSRRADRGLARGIAPARCRSMGCSCLVLYTALTLIRSAFEDRPALAAARANSPA